MATTTDAPVPAVQPAVRGYVLLLVSTVILSSTGVLIKFLLNDYQLEPLALAFWRVLLVGLALGSASSLLGIHRHLES